MSDEITLNLSGVLVDTTRTPSLQLDSIPLLQLIVDQAVRGGDSAIVPVGTSEQVIALAVTTYGYAFLQNLDDTNYIEYGPTASGSMVVFGKLFAGEWAVLRLDPGIVFRARAHTAMCDLLMKVWSN
jgi:hypothetical protein